MHTPRLFHRNWAGSEGLAQYGTEPHVSSSAAEAQRKLAADKLHMTRKFARRTQPFRTGLSVGERLL